MVGVRPTRRRGSENPHSNWECAAREMCRHSFGRHSDDSQLARELVSRIVDIGKFDPVDYTGRIAVPFHCVST